MKTRTVKILKSNHADLPAGTVGTLIKHICGGSEIEVTKAWYPNNVVETRIVFAESGSYKIIKEKKSN